jgi:hypothetical protein
MTDDDSGGCRSLNGGIFPRRLSSLRNRAPVTQTAMKNNVLRTIMQNMHFL